jgi:uncharacterized protein
MAPVNVFALEIADFKSGTRTVELSPTPEDLGLDPEVFRDIRIVAHLDRTGDRIFAQLEVTGTARLQCDRTLVDYDQDLEGRYGVLFAPAEELERLGGDQDEVREFDPALDELDVTEAVRDTLLLSIPLRRIAPGADDVPIRTSFGPAEDEAGDPRWDALRSLRDPSPDES